MTQKSEITLRDCIKPKKLDKSTKRYRDDNKRNNTLQMQAAKRQRKHITKETSISITGGFNFVYRYLHNILI